MFRLASLIVVVAAASGCSHAQEPSQCFGTTANGRLENGWKLPARGRNFRSYSSVGSLLGRTYVHSTVHKIVLNAYAAVADGLPEKTFVYGETGKKSGGEFSPHRTHRNGLSVDFMVPLLDENGRSVPMRTHAFNSWGYDLEFDASGRMDGFTIDADAMAEHIYQLHRAAIDADVDIRRVIFDPELRPLLHATSRWEYLENHIRFSKRRSWVRHDDHYHVDFAVDCASAAGP
ncbi:MAG: penicillin-insensitive murein endopeptidase [Woeseiaceae bacterium]|nr:penicillin-insensitive murein endopeptidase [Woeseiaceae bacterium]